MDLLCIEIQILIFEKIPYKYIKTCRQVCCYWNDIIKKHIYKHDTLSILYGKNAKQCIGCHLCENHLDHLLLYDSFEITAAKKNVVIDEELINYIKHAKFVKFYNISLNIPLDGLKFIRHIVIINNNKSIKTSCSKYIHTLSYVKTLDITESFIDNGIVPPRVECLSLTYKNHYHHISLDLCIHFLKEITCNGSFIESSTQPNLKLNKLVILTNDKYQIRNVLKRAIMTRVIHFINTCSDTMQIFDFDDYSVNKFLTIQ